MGQASSLNGAYLFFFYLDKAVESPMGGLACCSATWLCHSSPLSHHPACAGTLGTADGLPAHHATIPPLHHPTIALLHHPTTPSSHCPTILPPSACPPPAAPLHPTAQLRLPTSPKTILSTAPQSLTLIRARSNNWSLTSHLEPISAG